MDTKTYENWAEKLESGDYGKFVAVESNPYFQLRNEVELTLMPVIEIAKKNNLSIADLTKTLVTVGYKEGLTPA
jgi:hypothetical protein